MPREDAHYARMVDGANTTALGAVSLQEDSYSNGLNNMQNGLPIGGPFFIYF